MCKSARKSNHDIQNKAFLKSNESKIQTFASDSHILRPDDESSLTNMNTLDISMLSQDCEQSVPDSPKMINLKCVLYQMFCHKNQHTSNFFHQIRNQTCFPHRMCPPQIIPFLDLCSKHRITTMYRAHLCPAPCRRLAQRRPVWMKTTSLTYKASNHPHQSRKFYMTKQTQRNRVS